MRNWLAKHHYSTWMLVASIILGAATVHPRLANYILVGMNAGWLILIREMARVEGSATTYKLCYPCIIAAVVIIVIAFFVMLKINWLAL